MNVFVICIFSDECRKVYGNVSNSILLHLIRIWVFHARLVRVSQLIDAFVNQLLKRANVKNGLPALVSSVAN